jgi:hypothetical protein
MSRVRGLLCPALDTSAIGEEEQMDTVTVASGGPAYSWQEDWE